MSSNSVHDNDRLAAPPLIISKVGNLHNRIRRECDRIFREEQFPLEMDQLPVLAVLYYSGPLSQQEIGSKLLRDKASVNRTVSFLSKKDILKVIQDTGDKRKTRIELTAAGRKLAIRADAVLNTMNDTLKAAMSEKELLQFFSLIDKLLDSTCS